MDESSFTCLICDFGFAHFLGDEYSIVSGLKKPLTAGLTYAYASPELLDVVLNHETLSHNNEDEIKIDVYAFAITLYQVLSRKSPWDGLSKYEIYDCISEGQRPEFPKSEIFDKELVELIQNCWDQSPEKRPNFEDIYRSLSKP